MRYTKFLLGGLAVSALILAPMSGVASAKAHPPKVHKAHHHPHGHPHGPNKLKCFDGPSDGSIYGGKCTLLSKGAKGKATLDNTDSNPNGDYAGVYTAKPTISGRLLGQVKQLGYHYKGNIAPQPGNLSLNVPLDEDNNGTTEEYAFVDAFYCPGTNGAVNVVKDPNCTIYVGGVTPYPNWAALVAAHPTWRVATDNVPFIVAERTPSEPPAFWTVSNVKFGKPGK